MTEGNGGGAGDTSATGPGRAARAGGVQDELHQVEAESRKV
jgi:hypothetical protein